MENQDDNKLLILALENHKSGNFSTAGDYYKKALDQNPSDHICLYYYGLLCFELKKIEDAIKLISKSIAINPLPEAYLDLADIYNGNEDNKNAIKFYKKAIEFFPDDDSLLYNLGVSLIKEKAPDEAVNYLQEAYKITPDNEEVILALATALHNSGSVNESAKYYLEAIKLNPKIFSAYLNLGNLYLTNSLNMDVEEETDETIQLKNINKAIDYLTKAIVLNREDPAIHYHQGRLYLLNGEFQKGWAPFDEGRIHSFTHHRLKFPEEKAPKWRGESLKGKTIYVYETGGIGDTIQFTRYFPLLRAMGARVISKQRDLLENLYQENNLGIEIIQYNEPDENLEFDFQIPNMSLGRVFNSNAYTIPSKEGFLKANNNKVKEFKEKYFDTELFKVGITWRCWDQIRSVPLHYLENIFKIKGIQFYSFQTEFGGDELDRVKEKYSIINVGKDFKDFTDTAAAAENVNLYITIDTSAAHLLGAMGKPTLCVVPHFTHWTWTLNTKDNPWYDSIKVFRQIKKNDWTAPFEQIEKNLTSLLS